jgi:hypothetical protein
MKSLIRAGLIVGLGLGLNVLCGDAWADEDASAMTETSDEDRTAAPEQTGPSLAEPKAGAGSMEPAEAIKEDPGERVHEAWVESIWSTP